MNIANYLIERREFAVTAADVIAKGYMRLETYNVFLKDSPLEVVTLTQRAMCVLVYDSDNKPQITNITVCDAWVMDTATYAVHMVTLRPDQMLSIERDGVE